MKLETLDTLKDDDLQAISERCLAIVQKRKEDGDRKAIEDAIALLESRGIDPKKALLRLKPAKKTGKPAFVPKAGHLYQRQGHPNVTAKGTGVRPEWWHEDIAAGKLPVDLGPVVAMAKAS